MDVRNLDKMFQVQIKPWRILSDNETIYIDLWLIVNRSIFYHQPLIGSIILKISSNTSQFNFLELFRWK